MPKGIAQDYNFGLLDGERQNGIEQGVNNSYKSTLTANAGGGQANATQIPPNAQLVRLSTVATAGDSAKLPFAEAGTVKLIVNDTANSANLYAKNGTNRKTGTTDTINNAANGTAYALAAGKSAILFCPAHGEWFALLSA